MVEGGLQEDGHLSQLVSDTGDLLFVPRCPLFSVALLTAFLTHVLPLRQGQEEGARGRRARTPVEGLG